MKKEIVKFLVLALLAVGSGPAGAAIWNWSTTASSNANADPSINWSEGMAPSAVNDSGRAMMAAVAAWRNDISGVNTTTGTSTAYALATSEGVNTTPATGQMLAFFANVGNGVAATLAVDGGTAYPIQLNGVAAPAGTLVAATPYRVNFTGTAWALEAGYGNPYSVPLGGLLPFTLSTVPNSNFVFPAGQCLSTTTYATYWVALGSPASGSCPGGQFQIIDMSGRVAAGLDTMPGFAAKNRLTSASTGCGTAMTSVGAVCAGGSESHTLTVTELAAHSHGYTDGGHAHGIHGANYFDANVGAAGALRFPMANSGTQFFAQGFPYVFGTTDTQTIGITISNAGGGGAHTVVQPTIGLTYLLRVL